MGTSFGFFVGRRKMRFFGSFVLLVAFAVVVVSVLSVEGAEPGWGLRTDYEFDNCTGAGPGVERYLKNNTCIPTGSSSSNLYRFFGDGGGNCGVRRLQLLDLQPCAPCALQRVLPGRHLHGRRGRDCAERDDPADSSQLPVCNKHNPVQL